MGEHLLLEGRGGEMWLPYARNALKKLRARPGIAKQQVFALPRNQFIRIRHDAHSDFIHIKSSILDGYEFFTLIANPTYYTEDDSSYLYQVVRMEQDVNGGFGNAEGYNRAGVFLNPAEAVADSRVFLLSVWEGDVQQTQEVPRDTHYMNINATYRKVGKMMTTTLPTGRRHYSHTLHDLTNFDRSEWQGNPVWRGAETLPENVLSTVNVAGGMLLNNVWIMPWQPNREAKFQFRSKVNGHTINLQMPMPTWVNITPTFEIAWIANNDCDKMVAVHHHREIDGSGNLHVYQGWVELNFTASLDGSNNVTGQNITNGRIHTPQDDSRIAAIGYDMVDDTELIGVRFVSYLSDAYIDVAANPMATSGADRACRTLAIYAHWFKVNASNVEQPPFRKVLVWHGAYMGLTTETTYTDELSENYKRWNVDDISAAMEEVYGYPYYETQINALDMRGDAYAITRFMPNTGGDGTAGRWQTEYSAFGDAPVVADSGTNFSEPTLDLVNDFTLYDENHAMWVDDLIKAPDPSVTSEVAYRAYDWYIQIHWMGSAVAISPLGAGGQHREMDFGGFALHPNESWSVYLPVEFTYFNSHLQTNPVNSYATSAITMDKIVVKTWDSGTQTSTTKYTTTHLDVYNDIRAPSPALTYDDEDVVQQIMGSATWGINPEEYSNG